MILQFEDIHEYAEQEFYYSPNESVLEWRELLKDIHVSRAAGICSSGEVGLLTVLPCVEDELLLVDHSYNSLHVAVTKYLLLQEVGAEETHRTLCGQGAKERLEELADRLPFKSSPTYGSAWMAAGELPTCWKDIPIELVKAAEQKLDRVRFLHGDMRDLVDRGPFQLVYLSNAIDRHVGRFHKTYGVKDLEPMKAVAPGGYLALASSRYGSYLIPEGWTEVASTKQCGKLSWTQRLWQRDDE